MRLRDRVAKLEAEAVGAEITWKRRVFEVENRALALEKRLHKLENPSAVAWTGDVATVQNGEIYLNGKPLDMGGGPRAKSEP